MSQSSSSSSKKARNKEATIPTSTLFLTAIGKVMYNRPKLNRFISNRHMYEHNDILLSFVAKMTLDDKSEELMLVVPVNENDNIETIAASTAEKVSKLRGARAEKAGANNAVDTLGRLPNIIRVPIFGVLKLLGRYGMLPASLTGNNIYFTSISPRFNEIFIFDFITKHRVPMPWIVLIHWFRKECEPFTILSNNIFAFGGNTPLCIATFG